MASNFMLTSQNNIEVGEGEEKLQCASICSQIDCDLRYFNISIQTINNKLVEDNLDTVKEKIENEMIIILKKAKEMGWDIFDNINEKLNK